MGGFGRRHPRVAHRPVWVELSVDGAFLLECECGEVFERGRLSDAAVAWERHEWHHRSIIDRITRQSSAPDRSVEVQR